MKKVLVLDFGATSGRAMLCGYEDNMFCSSEIYRFGYNWAAGEKMRLETDGLFKEVSKALEKAHEYAFDAVSVDAWGMDFALLDQNGDLLTKELHLSEQKPETKKWDMNGLTEQDFFKCTGVLSVGLANELCGLKKKNPELLDKAARLLMTPDLINFYLTGEMKNEYTAAVATGLVNHEKRDWDEELIQKLGLPKRIFGALVQPGEIYGYLKPDFTNREIPVYVAPGHDAACAAVAVPSPEREFAYICCGTSAICGTELYAPVATEEAMEKGFTNAGGYGGTINFFRTANGTSFLQQCRRCYNTKGESFTFNDMEAFARSAPHFVTDLDLNDPIFAKDTDVPQRVREYCERYGKNKPKTVAQTLRSVYESIAGELVCAVEQMERITGKSYKAVYITGGGSKDKLLCQLVADASNRLVVAGPAEATALGNATSALIALGEIESVKEARSIIRRSSSVKEFYPRNHKEWEERLKSE